MMLNNSKYLILLLLILLVSCSKNEEIEEEVYVPTQEEIEREQHLNECEALSKIDSFPAINYKQIYVESAEQLAKLKNEYQKSDSIKEQHTKYRVFTTLNRKELRFMRVGDTLIIPDTIIADLRAYSVFPDYYCDASHLKKLIVVSNVWQAYACYEYGKLIKFTAANTGKETTPTYPGRYALEWRQRLRHSSLDSTWILPFTFNFHRQAGNAFHQFEMPGRPVSHSCVRQFIDDAEWLYKWGKGAKYDSLKRPIYMSGTPVIMLGMFDYTRKKGGPWLNLKSNKEKVVELSGDPMQVEEAIIPISQIPKTSRGSLRNRKRYIYGEDTLRARGIIREHIELIPSVDYNKRRRERQKQKQLELQKKQNEEQKSNENSIESTQMPNQNVLQKLKQINKSNK